jgi:hypothetical protein
MWQFLKRLFTRSDGTPLIEYDPIYGLRRGAVDEWLARNPIIKVEYDAMLRSRMEGRADWPSNRGRFHPH